MMSREGTTTTDWLHLVQAEYLEMPGLQLTKAQVRRLWGLEDNTCEAVLAQLQAMHFLRRTARDLYVLDGSACVGPPAVARTRVRATPSIRLDLSNHAAVSGCASKGGVVAPVSSDAGNPAAGAVR